MKQDFTFKWILRVALLFVFGMYGVAHAQDATYVWYCNDTLIPGVNTRTINSSGLAGEYAYRREMYIDGKRVRPDFQLRMVVESKGPEGWLSGEKGTACPGTDVRLALDFKGKAPFRYRITGDKKERLCFRSDTVIRLTAVAGVVYQLDYLADVDGIEAGIVKRTGKVVVYPAFTPGAIASVGESVCPGSAPSLIGETTAATGGDGTYTYSWYKGEDLIAGATSTTYQPGALTVGATYTRKVKDGTCNTEPEASTNSYKITVRKEFNSGAIASAGTTICHDAIPLLIREATAATGGDGNYTYSWLADGAEIADAKEATYQPGALTAGATYTRKVNDGACHTEPAASSGSYIIMVREAFNAGAIASTGEIVCSGATPSLIRETTAATGGDGSYTYSWYKDGSATAIVGATKATYQPGALSVGATYTRKVKDGTCNTEPGTSTNSYKITVRKEFNSGAIASAGTTICHDAIPLLIREATAATGGDGNYTYSWLADGAEIADAKEATYQPGALTAGATYTRKVADGMCNTVPEASANSYQITVRGKFNAGAIASADTTICYRATPSLIRETAVAMGGDGNYTYSWYKDGVKITGVSGATYQPSALTAGATYTRKVRDGMCHTEPAASTNSYKITVRPRTEITTQPKASTTLCVGGTLSLSIAASGEGLTYQWLRGNKVLTGATGAVLTVTSVGLADAGLYRCAISSGCGRDTSEQAMVTVNEPIAISTQPSDATLCFGAKLSLSVVVSGTSPSYQWYQDGSKISGATGSRYEVASVEAVDGGAYTCKVTGACGTVESGSATVMVFPEFDAGAIASAATTICHNAIPSLIRETAVATGGDGTYTYSWFADGVEIAGATGATYQPGALTTGATYTRKVADGTCNTEPTASAGEWRVTVNLLTAITTQPAAQTLCQEKTITLSVAATGAAPLTYRWQRNSVNIPGATGAIYNKTGAWPSSDSGEYRCVVTDKCGADTSEAVTVTVNPSVMITEHPEGVGRSCEGFTLSLKVTATGTAPLAFQWKKDSVDIPGAIEATYTKTNALLADAGEYRCVVSGGCGFEISNPAMVRMQALPDLTTLETPAVVCPGEVLRVTVPTVTWNCSIGITGWKLADKAFDPTAAVTFADNGRTLSYFAENSCGRETTSVTVSVNPPTVITTQPTARNICQTEAISLSVVATGMLPLSYQWQKEGTDILGATGATYIKSDALPTDGGEYRCVVTGGCGAMTSDAVPVTVLPSFVSGAIASSDTTLCVGGTLTLRIVAGGEGNSYQWLRGDEVLTGATKEELTIFTASVTDAGRYRCAISGSCGRDTSEQAMVTVNEQIAISTQPSDTTLCFGVKLSLSVVATGTSPSYQWYRNGTGIAGAVGSRYEVASAEVVDGGRYTCKVTGACGAVESDAVTVTVHPEFNAGAIASADTTICYGATPSLIGETTAASGGDGAIAYSWYKDDDVIDGATYAIYYPGKSLTSSATFTRKAKDGTCNTVQETSANSYKITIRPAFAAGAIASADTTICYGATPSLIRETTAASGGDGTIVYSWYKDGSSTAIANATSATYTPGALTDTTVFTRKAKDGTCNAVPESSVGAWKVTVRPKFTSGEIASTGETVCYNTVPTKEIGSPTAASGGDGAIAYSWYKDGSSTAIANATSATYTPGALTDTTVFTRKAKDGACNTVPETSVGAWKVTVRPKFTSGEIASTGEAICYNTAPTKEIGSTTDASGGDGVITYSWYKGSSTTAISGATYAIYYPSKSLTSSATFTRKAKDGTCNTTPEVSAGEWTVTVLVDGPGGGCTDGDGNKYETVWIGSQEWMAENLKTMHKCGASWDNDTFGRLYTWDAAMDCVGSSNKNPSGVQGLCPGGWHLPSDEEWTQLNKYVATKFLGIGVGKVLKSKIGWNDYPDAGNGTDNVGFCGRPGGYCNTSGDKDFQGKHGWWWSSTAVDNDIAWYRTLNYDDTGLSREGFAKMDGYSIRCVKD